MYVPPPIELHHTIIGVCIGFVCLSTPRLFMDPWTPSSVFADESQGGNPIGKALVVQICKKMLTQH